MKKKSNDISSPTLCVMTGEELKSFITEAVRDVLKENKENGGNYFQSFNKDEYITANEIRDMLQVDLSTLWRWGKDGRLTRYHMGPRQVRYKLSEVKEFIEKSNINKKKVYGKKN